MTVAPGLEFELPEGVASAHFLNPWCEESDLIQGRLEKVTDVDQHYAIEVATELLFLLTGRQFNTGRSIVRPCSIQGAYGNQSYLYPYSSMSGYGQAWGFAAGWSWTAIGMGWWQNGQDLSEVVLQGPVVRINNVMVDGYNLGSWEQGQPSNPNYTLYDRRRLIRNVNPSNGNVSSAWPWNQQIQLPVSNAGTWLIDYNWGVGPGALGKAACAALATEVALALSGSNKTQLPQRVQSVATSGVTTLVGDALTFIRADLTGIPLVDMFINAVNPHGRRRRPVFMAPNSTIKHEQPTFP